MADQATDKKEPSHWPRDFEAINRPDPKAVKAQAKADKAQERADKLEQETTNG